MKRTEPMSLGDILSKAFEQAGITDQLAQQRACFIWPEIVGHGINRLTTRRYVENGVMHVYISSAPLKQELSFHRERLVELINKAVGSNVIHQIQFH